MSLRFFSNVNGLPFLSAVLIAFSLSGSALAASGNVGSTPPVQTYIDQAAPTTDAPTQEFYDSPLSAGTLTLQDVLEAHKPVATSPTLPAIGQTPSATATAPLLTPPKQSSSTGLMMSQGMKEVLQKVGDTKVIPVQVRDRDAQSSLAQGQPTPLVETPPAVPGAPDLKYEPGREPKNLAQDATTDANARAQTQTTSGTQSSEAEPAAVAVSSSQASPSQTPSLQPTSSPASSSQAPTTQASLAPAPSCDEHVTKWLKSCTDAGYPATYEGIINGETRTGCTDGALHDVWVTNTCAPPDASAIPSQTASTNAVCGAASGNSFDDAPSSNLCKEGKASAVNGNGPWTWACSGINGGAPAACSAYKRTAMVSGSCGDANGVTASSAPTADLCSAGHATPVQGSGPWTWSCKGSSGGSTQSCIAPLAEVSAVPAASIRETQAAPSVAPVAEAVAVAPVAATPAEMDTTPAASSSSVASSDKGELCGTAAETLAYEAPVKDLCRIGNPSSVSGNGPWNWSCTDNEGRSSSCRTMSLAQGSSSSDAAPEAAAVAPTAEAAQAAASEIPPASQSVVSTSPRTAPPSSEDFVAPVPKETPSSELACGAAATQPAQEVPTSALCENGKASSVRGSGPWHWTCTNKAHRKVTCETTKTTDASCGAANGTSLKSAPFAGLCSSGTPTGIDGNGPWTWTCNGSGGGVNVSCAAALLQTKTESNKVDGACGATANTTLVSAPRSDLCASGVASAVSGEGPWSWSCSGSNGGAVSTCSALKVADTQPPGPLTNGLCGSSNGATATSAPVDGLCSTGTPTRLAGNGPWNWSCLGENGGMTVSCTAPLEAPSPVDGICGGASGVSTMVKPQSALCSSGITGTVSGRGPWTWTCSGANGGTASSCVAPVAGKTSSTPSLTSTSSNDTTMAAVAPAPIMRKGLVTPQLPSSDMPDLDQQVVPSLTSSKSFAQPPTPSSVPPSAAISGIETPDSAPDVPAGIQPVQPPSFGNSLPSAPVLQENGVAPSSHIPGNHLTLDPTVSTVLFTRGSGNIDETVLATLDKLASILNANTDVRITLTAYADNTGSTPRDARRLSLTRALAVRDYLSNKGISESRIDVRAEGANTTSGYIDRVDVKVNE